MNGTTSSTGVSFPRVVTPATDDNEMIDRATDRGDHLLYNPTANDSGSILSNQQYALASSVVECGIIPVLSLLGLPANIINMVVFYRQGLRDKMNLCLFALACVDFVYLFSVFLTTLYCPASFLSSPLWEQTLKWHTRTRTINFTHGFMYSSGVLTAIIATERCICVVWPLKSATILKTKTMAWLIWGTILGINLLCLPQALRGVVTVNTGQTGRVRVTFTDSDIYTNNKHIFLVIRDTILPGISFITFFIVSFVTVVTVRKLKTAMDWRQKTSSNVMDKRQMTLVKILITVSCVYIACNTPNILLSVTRILVEDFSTVGKYRKLSMLTHRSDFGLLMVNSSVNIIIYYVQSSMFRKNLVCACCQRQRSD